jgi:hypothetical protein
VNFVGHVEVARLHRGPAGAEASTVGFLVGAALPDLAAIGRFRLLERPADPAVAAGVDLHHRTDEAFHRHHWFRSNCAGLTARLEQLGLGRGAARACGHVGVELLLDGHLLTDRAGLRPSVQGAIEAAGRGAAAFGDLVAPAHRGAWHDHLERLGGWEVPADYHHPEAVAARLQRILSSRSRLAFPAREVGSVARALAERNDAVVAGADPLLADLYRELAATP